MSERSESSWITRPDAQPRPASGLEGRRIAQPRRSSAFRRAAASGGEGASRRRGRHHCRESGAAAWDGARPPVRRAVGSGAPAQGAGRGGGQMGGGPGKARRPAWCRPLARVRHEARANCRGCARTYRMSLAQDQARRASVIVPANPVQTRRRPAYRRHAARGCAARRAAQTDTGRSESGRSCGNGSCGRWHYHLLLPAGQRRGRVGRRLSSR